MSQFAELKHDNKILMLEPGINGLSQIYDINGTELKRIYEEYYDEQPKSLNSSDSLGAKKVNNSSHSWVSNGNNFFVTAKPNCESIPAGLYDIASSMDMGIYLKRRGITLDSLFYIPDEIIEEILEDFKKFWESKERYELYGFTHKRGIMMYGPTGSGKTSIINLLIKFIVEEYNGIVLNMDNIDTFISMVHSIKALEGDRPILTIIEDIDGFLEYNSTKQFLNLLDGNLQVGNIIYFATTNYPERIEPRIINRPSRFDLVKKIGNPSPEARLFYIEHKLLDEDKEKYADQIDQWVNDTQDMSFSHLKELIASVVVMGNDYRSTIERLKNMGNIA